jgi:hypothetical protein
VQLHSVYRLHVRRYNSCTKLCKSENLTWLSRGASLCTICYFCTRQTVTYMPRNVTRPARNPDRSHAYALQPDEHMHHAHQSLSGRVLQRAGVAHSITHAWLEFESRRPVARRDAGPRPAPPRSSQPRIFPSRAATQNPGLGSLPMLLFLAAGRPRTLLVLGGVVRARRHRRTGRDIARAGGGSGEVEAGHGERGGGDRALPAWFPWCVVGRPIPTHLGCRAANPNHRKYARNPLRCGLAYPGPTPWRSVACSATSQSRNGQASTHAGRTTIPPSICMLSRVGLRAQVSSA